MMLVSISDMPKPYSKDCTHMAGWNSFEGWYQELSNYRNCGRRRRDQHQKVDQECNF